MSDLIDRQAAIDAVAKWFYDVFGIKESDGTATIFKRLRELPSAQPEHKTGRWIPCSERLPEEDVDVLICYKYKEGEGDSSHVYINITSYGQAYFGGRKCSFKEWRSPFEYFHANYEVVAWMPLPEPYKGEER